MLDISIKEIPCFERWDLQGVASQALIDDHTPDLLPTKRPRGRPRTGKAMTQAERQAKYRAKVSQNNVTVTLNRGLLERLDAQMQALRDGSSVQILTPDEAAQVLESLRRAQLVQLRRPA